LRWKCWKCCVHMFAAGNEKGALSRGVGVISYGDVRRVASLVRTHPRCKARAADRRRRKYYDHFISVLVSRIAPCKRTSSSVLSRLSSKRLPGISNEVRWEHSSE